MGSVSPELSTIQLVKVFIVKQESQDKCHQHHKCMGDGCLNHSRDNQRDGTAAAIIHQQTFQMNATNFNNNNNQLPKFQDTFDSGNTWSANSSRRGSLENNTGSIFGNSSRKVDIAAEVDNVVYEDVKNWVNSSMKSL